MSRKMVRLFVAAAVAAPLALAGSANRVQAQMMDGVDVSAFVDFYYGYYFNKVNGQGVRSFDGAHNNFSLSMAELAIEKAPSMAGDVGARIDLDFGPTADAVNGVGTYRQVQQAYVSWMASDQLTLDVGKFVTPIGAEVIESQDNWNYTRGILFGYAIPFHHTGVRATVAANDQVSVSGFLVNGWATPDNNSDKTFIGSVSLSPTDMVGVTGNFIAGKEGDNDGDGKQDMRWLFDGVVSIAATDMVSLMANIDYGQNSNAVAATGGGFEAAKWWGIAAYARIQAQDNWAVAGRLEYVNDEDGFMGIGRKAQSFTVTSDHVLGDGLIARIDFHLDRVNTPSGGTDFFTNNKTAPNNRTSSQPSLTIGLVYSLN